MTGVNEYFILIVMNSPFEVTNFNRTDKELQKFWLFCLFVAGKNSDTQLRKLNQFLKRAEDDNVNPFDYLKDNLLDLRNMLVVAKVGQYNRLVRAIEESIYLDLKTCSLKDLMGVFGIGPKSARFFLLHTRKDCEHVVLDTHILSWLREHNVETPPNTPPEPKYSYFEGMAQALFGAYFDDMPMAEIDLLIWGQQSGRLDVEF